MSSRVCSFAVGPATALALATLACRSGSPPVAPPAPIEVGLPESGPSRLQRELAATPSAPPLLDAAAARRLDGALAAFERDHPSRRAYLAVDKPLYRPGETIWFRAFDLGSADLAGTPDEHGISVQLVSPRGSVVGEKQVLDQAGLATNDFELPADLPGGEYTLTATSDHGTAVERKVIVAAYQPPRIKKKLEFLRKAYGPGDTVAAAVALERATGEALAGKPAIGQVVIDGAEVARVPVTTDAAGKVVVRFALPAAMQRGDGLLTVLVEDGGLTESIQKRIPITLDKLQLALYPEGGALVRGLPGRVYFRATNMLDKPADIEGRVVDDQGRAVARFRSLHDGMGRFELTPAPGRTYQVEITRPVGIASRFEVPAARADGCAMQAVDDFDSERPELRVAVWCARAQPVVATAVLRDRPLGSVSAAVPAGKPAVLALPAPAKQGAVRVTVFDRDLAPLAERLIYRNRKSDLKVTITPDRTGYNPRDRVTLAVETTDPDGKPVAADLALAVVDDTVLSFADDKTGHVLSRLYLESEMPGQEVEEPNFYFSDEPDAAASLDLVLGTHGWRRFDWKPLLEAPPPEPIDEPWSFAGVLTDRRDHPRVVRRAVVADRDDDDDQAMGEEAEAGADRKPKEDAQRRAEPKLAERERPAVAKAPPRVAAKAPDRPRPAAPRAQPVQPGPDVPPPAAATPPMPEPVMAGEALAPMAMDMADDEGMEDELYLDIASEADLRRAIEGDFEIGQAVARRGRRLRAVDENQGDDFGGTWVSWAPVRVFPAPRYEVRHDGPRTDFRDTIMWQPRVQTDAAGKATVELYLSDAVTSFRATAEGVGDGRAGRGEAVVKSKLPVSLAVKMPLEVSTGDVIDLPVTVTNETDQERRASLVAEFGPAFRATGSAPPSAIELAPNQSRSFLYHLAVVGDGADPGAGKATVSLESEQLRDHVERTIRVVPLGFPQELSIAGTLADTARHEVVIGDILGGDIDARVTLYPSPIATLTKGSDALLAEPGGCFEQASSTNYPNVMVLAYLARSDDVDPEVVERSKGLLERGYKLLSGYESPNKGYEWFGSDPGHEALTAYGLMEFHDMAAVYDDVDESMVARTAAWLERRRDGKGGYQRNPAQIDSFGAASVEVTNAYITYALSEAGSKHLDAELDAAARLARSTKDPYLLALAANALVNRRAGAGETRAALSRLVDAQDADGSFPGADHSITRSGGAALTIETTSLAALALMRDGNRHMPAVRRAIEWLDAHREGNGSYGSTQSTILSFKAMTAWAEYNRRTTASGVVEVLVDGKPAGRVAYEKGHQGAIEIDLAGLLHPGKNRIELHLDSAEPLPYSGAIRFRSRVPATSPRTQVGLTTRLARAQVPMGESVRLDVELSNRTDHGLPMVLARVGMPGGLSFQTWQLKELRDKKLIDFYETREREVILYLRAMAPHATRSIPLELKADVPGTYVGPASQAYLYYTDEDRVWNQPSKVTIR